jgi:hypothetical protein
MGAADALARAWQYRAVSFNHFQHLHMEADLDFGL